MFVNVSISLTEGDTAPTRDPKEILSALGGDPEKDTINVSVSASHAPPPLAPPTLENTLPNQPTGT